MRTSDFDYELPEDLIAQRPAEDRDHSRMLSVDRASGSLADRTFGDLPQILAPDDVLVLNNTKVFPARLLGRSETGSNVEIFLIEEIDGDSWSALARPAKRLKPGRRVDFGDGLSAEILGRTDDGRVNVRLAAAGDVMAALEKVGRTPLPPYIKRTTELDEDRERYQTVYARNSGAIAAPTAGLHFTAAVLEAIRGGGIEIAEVTLHVGYGTFEPVRVDEVSEHRVLPERYEIDEQNAAILNAARSDGRRIIAVGTTTTRTLESAIAPDGTHFETGPGIAEITVTPGYRFKAVDGLLTNFHLPQSSLLILVSTFGGYELIMRAYKHAVDAQYRFYSYGDCMLIT